MNRYYRGNFFGTGRRVKHALGLGIGLLCLYLFIGGDSGLLQIWRQDRRRHRLEEELQKQQRLNVERRSERDALQRGEPSVVEKRAREELGMVKKGEEVFQVLVEDGKK